MVGPCMASRAPQTNTERGKLHGANHGPMGRKIGGDVLFSFLFGGFLIGCF